MTGLKRFLAAAVLAIAGIAAAEESDPLPVPGAGPRQHAVTLYNEGVELLLAKRYADAQVRFEQAIAAHEPFAEAHNNLAFSLRMQGSHNNERALRHYARALQVDPRLGRAYMYRGSLYAQMGDLGRARADLEVLRTLDGRLAAKLEKALSDESARNDRDGVSAQIDDVYK